MSRFPDVERQHLLSMPRIGPRVVERLEALGLTSLDTLRSRGLDRTLGMLCRADGSPAWLNRRRALQCALESFMERAEHEDPVQACARQRSNQSAV